jgi:hypothetical protein
MRESQLDSNNITSTQSLRPALEREESRATLAPEDGFSPVLAQGGHDAASHARELNRITRGAPSRASHSLLQMQRTHGNRYVQRVLEIARQEDGKEGAISPEVEASIERSRGGGQSLENGTRSQMESAFGVDFSGVRIHTGAESHSLNRAVSAVAFTTGSDIFFRDGAYEPGSSGGRELLAHELTHVVQQGHAPATSGQSQSSQIHRMCSHCKEEENKKIHPKLEVGHPDSVYEKEAEEVSRLLTRQDNSPKETTAENLFDFEASGSSKDQHARPAPAQIELIPDRPLDQQPSTANSSTATSPGHDVINVREAVMSRNGISRRISLSNLAGAWVARKMNWKRTACHAACWALGGGITAAVAAACAIGSTFTLGGLVIPCTAAVIATATAGAGLAAICSDLCDSEISDTSAASAPQQGSGSGQGGAPSANPDGAGASQ